MKKPATDIAASPQKVDDEKLRIIRHDINNQLSNILLALEQLRYEISDISEDCQFYLDAISMSSYKIAAILEGEGGK